MMVINVRFAVDCLILMTQFPWDVIIRNNRTIITKALKSNTVIYHIFEKYSINKKPQTTFLSEALCIYLHYELVAVRVYWFTVTWVKAMPRNLLVSNLVTITRMIFEKGKKKSFKLLMVTHKT